MAPDPSQKSKRKKNAPDKLQPKWLHPPDEENPILNPKPISEERKAKDKEEWDKALKFLNYHSVDAPMIAPPPAMLLTLVGAFLSSYGFNSASRIYTTQLASRKKLDEWKVELGVKLPKGFPDLVKIFKDWYKAHQEKTQSEMTSSDDDSEDSTPVKPEKRKRKPAQEAITKTEETSSSDGSSDEGNSNIKIESTEPLQKPVTKKIKTKSPSSSPQTSDSDADNEEESEGANLAVPKSPSGGSSSNSSSSSSSSSSSGSESEAPNPKKSSKTTKKPLKKKPKAKGQLSEKPVPPKPAEPSSKASTDSSVTLQPTSPTKPFPKSASPSASSSSSSLSSSPEPPPEKTTTTTTIKPKTSKRKHKTPSPSSPLPPTTTDNPEATEPAAKKPKNDRSQRFQRVPSDTKIDPKLASNAYRSHEYGDRAHQDLSVTRGKGFTKEKNKKKRGSYRGGAIDVSGGKGVKFG